MKALVHQARSIHSRAEDSLPSSVLSAVCGLLFKAVYGLTSVKILVDLGDVKGFHEEKSLCLDPGEGSGHGLLLLLLE